MKSAMLSIKPKYCELIISGKKTIEVRKTRPKIETPFKCYIYCTKEFYRKGNGYFQGKYCGKVIGEFVCDYITAYPYEQLNDGEHYMPFGDLEKTCLDGFEIYDYLGTKDGYGWHISDLVVYDEPKELNEFKKYNRECWYADLGLAKRDCPECQNRECFLTQPPQSWCYVEELKCQQNT